MAKNMAIIDDGIVSNVIYCDDLTAETETRKDVFDIPVSIGDTYAAGKFYRDGELLRSEAERIFEMQTALGILGVSA